LIQERDNKLFVDMIGKMWPGKAASMLQLGAGAAYGADHLEACSSILENENNINNAGLMSEYFSKDPSDLLLS
jgi:hypothetical protein